jgi:hypothetical protein
VSKEEEEESLYEQETEREGEIDKSEGMCNEERKLHDEFSGLEEEVWNSYSNFVFPIPNSLACTRADANAHAHTIAQYVHR